MPKRKREEGIDFQEDGVTITDVNDPEQNKHISDVPGRKRYRQLRPSNFHLIVNTNQRHNAGSKELEEECFKLREAMQYLLTEEGVEKFLIFLEQGHSWSTEYIKKVRTMAAIER